jgi:hypothetical protein
MARQTSKRDISGILSAASTWIEKCLVEDGSLFGTEPRWTKSLLDEIYRDFVEHPDEGGGDFLTKLKGQLKQSSPEAIQLMAEMQWAVLLFPSNMKPQTKRLQIREIWALSGTPLHESSFLLTDAALAGIGSGGMGFHSHRFEEIEYLLLLVRDLKGKRSEERARIFAEYGVFYSWIESVPRRGSRQFRHMLRYFAFPDLVERISSNGDRREILEKFGVAPRRVISGWADGQLDEKLLQLRREIESGQPGAILDFYEPPLRERWIPERKIRTAGGEISFAIPVKDEEPEHGDSPQTVGESIEARQSIRIQAKLARIGALLNLKVWLPASDRGRVRELLTESERAAILDELNLIYEPNALDTVKQIDVLWIKRNSIAQAFEVEHTTAVYSGLLHMADLLSLQPNLDISLHIVAPEERREKVFRELMRPVFAFLERGPLSNTCTFISYESVEQINRLEHLAYMNDSILEGYEESAPDPD